MKVPLTNSVRGFEGLDVHPSAASSSDMASRLAEVADDDRELMLLFFRVKDLRDISPKDEQFVCRWRYWAYFDCPALRKQLASPDDQLLAGSSVKSFDDLVKSNFKKKVSNISTAASDLLPTLSVGNKVSSMEVSGAAELIVKNRAEVGFDFCVTEQLCGAISYDFDLRGFPFGAHWWPVSFRSVSV